MKYEVSVKFRCTRNLDERFGRICAYERRSEPDLLRIVVEDFVADRERRHGPLLLDLPLVAKEHRNTKHQHQRKKKKKS